MASHQYQALAHNHFLQDFFQMNLDILYLYQHSPLVVSIQLPYSIVDVVWRIGVV